MYSKRILSVLLGLVTTACSGTVVMSPLDPADIEKNYEQKADMIGIVVYRAIPLVEVDRFIQVNVPAKSGQPNGPTMLSSACNPILTRKLVSVADSQHPYRLHYDHGFLESYTFGATLTNDGILTAINTVSTPDQGKTLQNLAGAAAAAGGITKFAAPTKRRPDCTITPVFVGYEMPPTAADIKKFGETH